jgi:Ser/Thr protein kinase RdoA (MazF antagonist)
VQAGLAWAESVTGARVVRSWPIGGGNTGNVFALDTSDRKSLVLKLYRPDPREPDSAWREAHILDLIADRGLPAPRAVAFDREGKACGRPVLLMTRVSGSLRARPTDRPQLRELVTFARRIHEVQVGQHQLPAYKPWGLDGRLSMPHGWTDRAVWKAAVVVAKAPAPREGECFIHRDFHPGNVLWSGARIAGVVDWLHGCWGPPSVDFAHCRLNLWLDHGPAVADAFMKPDEIHPYWDIVDALGWSPSTTGLRRFESFVTAAVSRL